LYPKLGSLFDINKRIPINYYLSKGQNEGDILINQLEYVNAGDTLIMDGGYYSKKLVELLVNKNINFVFRIRSNISYAKNYIGNNKLIRLTFDTGVSVDCKVIKFMKGGELTYLITNLINRNARTLTNYYALRWGVETDFRKCKYDVMYNKLRSKTEKQIMIDVKILNFIGILIASLESVGVIDRKKKINTKNVIEILHNRLLHPIIYEEMTPEMLNNIFRIVSIVLAVTELVRKNRIHKRIRVSPSTKWNAYGNRYGGGYGKGRGGKG
jgi:NADH:ubiquinone oxidoreductase subunit K